MLNTVSFEDIIECREQSQRLFMKCAQAGQGVFNSSEFRAQNNARAKKPEGQFKSVKGGPIWPKKDVLKQGSSYFKVAFLTKSTFFSLKIQDEFSCYKGEALTDYLYIYISARKQTYDSWDLMTEG